MLHGRFFLTICLAVLFTPVYCSAQTVPSDFVAALQREYQGKVLIIRGFYSGGKLQFDTQGKLVGEANRGYWSSDGLVYLTSVSLEQQELHFSGQRVISLFDNEANAFKDFRTHEQIDIDIQADTTWKDLTACEAVVNRVFTSDRNYFAAEAPDYWRRWLSGPIEELRAWQWRSKGQDTAPPISSLAAAAYRVGAGVSAPRALVSPDPEYSDVARKAKLRGTTQLLAIINERGEPTEILIVRPLGAGLDDRAVETVRKWKFVPAMKDGHPVPVKINIEVNFR